MLQIFSRISPAEQSCFTTLFPEGEVVLTNDVSHLERMHFEASILVTRSTKRDNHGSKGSGGSFSPFHTGRILCQKLVRSDAVSSLPKKSF